MARDKMRFGIIGLGKMGLLHASLLNTLPDVEIVALCDKSVLMTRLFRKAFSQKDIRIVNDHNKLADLQVDAVYVTTPISSHSSIIKDLISKGITKNVFSEKTLASDYNQALDLCNMMKKAGGIGMVGYMKRFSVVFQKAKELLSNGGIGEMKSFKAYAFSSDFLSPTKKSRSPLPRGGPLRDIGCHVIDLALWFFGDLKVHEGTSNAETTGTCETAASFTVTNNSGLCGQVDVSQCLPNYRMPEFGVSIEGSNGKLDVNDDRLVLALNDGFKQSWYKHDLNDNAFFSIGECEYFRENEHFVNSLLQGKQCCSSFEDASEVDLLIDEVKRRIV